MHTSSIKYTSRLLRHKDGAPPVLDIWTSQFLVDAALYVVLPYPPNTTFAIDAAMQYVGGEGAPYPSACPGMPTTR